VRDQDERDAELAAEVRERRLDLLARPLVEGRGRLLEEERLRLERERARA
jgi:hypothetical protein